MANVTVDQTAERLQWYEALLRGRLPDLQQQAMADDWDRRHFGQLELVRLAVSEDEIVFVLAAPDGSRVGKRFAIRDPATGEVDLGEDLDTDADSTLCALWEVMVTAERVEPDADGVRWLR